MSRFLLLSNMSFFVVAILLITTELKPITLSTKTKQAENYNSFRLAY